MKLLYATSYSSCLYKSSQYLGKEWLSYPLQYMMIISKNKPYFSHCTILDKNLIAYRYHPSNLTSEPEKMKATYFVCSVKNMPQFFSKSYSVLFQDYSAFPKSISAHDVTTFFFNGAILVKVYRTALRAQSVPKQYICHSQSVATTYATMYQQHHLLLS